MKENKPGRSEFTEKDSKLLQKKSIEATGEIWAVRLRHLLGGEIRGNQVLVVNNKDREVLNYPPLIPRGMTESKSKRAGVSYDPDSGDIVISRWDTPATQVYHTLKGVERKTLVDPQDYIGLRIPRHHKADLDNMPPSWEVRNLVLQRFKGGITDALRQRDLIREDYGGGVETEVVENLFAGVHALADIFKNQKITVNDLRSLHNETLKLLESHGLDKAKEEGRVRIFNSMLKAVKKDSLQRINPLVSRIHLRSAHRNIVVQEVEKLSTWEKAEEGFNILYMEWEDSMTAMREGREFINTLLSPVIENPEIYESKKKFPDKMMTQLVADLRLGVDVVFDWVRVNPFNYYAGIVQAWMTDVNYWKKDKREKIDQRLEVVNMQEELGRTSVEKYLKQRNIADAAVALYRADSLLKAITEDPDNYVITVF